MRLTREPCVELERGGASTGKPSGGKKIDTVRANQLLRVNTALCSVAACMGRDQEPPIPGTGRGRVIAIWILLLMVAGGIGGWFIYHQSQTPPPEPERGPPPKSGLSRRAQALAKPALEIPEVIEEQPVEPEPVERPQKRSFRSLNWDCSGEISTAEVSRVVQSQYAQVRSCYEMRLKVDNMLQGTLNLKLRIDAGGKVSAVRVGGSLTDGQVRECVRKLSTSWTFPAPAQDNCSVVSVPFRFDPKTG